MSQKLYDQLMQGTQGLANGTLRDVILPAILGKETDEMLYWIGKDLARAYPVATTTDLVTLTAQLGLGTLIQRKHNRTSQIWRLEGSIIKERIQRDEEATSFGLECGFLAQEIEFQLGTVAEAKIMDRHHEYVDLLVQNDPQTDANGERTEMATFIQLQHPNQSVQPAKQKGLLHRRDKNN